MVFKKTRRSVKQRRKVRKTRKASLKKQQQKQQKQKGGAIPSSQQDILARIQNLNAWRNYDSKASFAAFKDAEIATALQISGDILQSRTITNGNPQIDSSYAINVFDTDKGDTFTIRDIRDIAVTMARLMGEVAVSESEGGVAAPTTPLEFKVWIDALNTSSDGKLTVDVLSRHENSIRNYVNPNSAQVALGTETESPLYIWALAVNASASASADDEAPVLFTE